MKKMWTGVTDGVTNKIADDFNSSISFDSRMFAQDIKGSIAHAMMLAKQSIISEEEKNVLIDGLSEILEDLSSGKLQFDENAEDIHMFVEQILTERVGETGKKLHTARSRNDQVALDFRMYVRDEIKVIITKLKSLISSITTQAETNYDVIMPGYTHLQRAQPITFGHHLMAYASMFMRDIARLEQASVMLDVCPIGSCALAGTTYNTDRIFEAEQLGFSQVSMNSIDGVSDRDFAVDFLSACSLIMMHLSRFSEEIILWSSWEFKFVELSSEFTTGSSIMPQKRNPDMAELVRGKTGRVYGDLMALLTTLKGIPLAYNKDMQEDKESVFDACDTVKACLDVFAPMIKTMKVLPENTLLAAQKGFINATDLADYLVKKGLPFRSAYKISGEIVKECLNKGLVLETLSLEEYKKHSDLFENDLFGDISLKTCVEKRISLGGTSPSSVLEQIKLVKGYLEKNV